MWNRKNIIITFTVPFLIVGAFSSFYAVSFMYTLPEFMHQPLDCIYAVFVSFLDMGTTGGLGALICLSLISKLKNYIDRRRQVESS